MATKISVITPCFNHAPFIRETIESILSQNYPNLEYIVIDGGSTDGSAEIIREYEAHLAYFVSEPDRGHGHALNKGFAKSTGEIMAWLNSDDKYMPKSLQTVADIFDQNPQIHWIVGTNGWWNDRGAMVWSNNIYKNVHDFLRGDFDLIQQESVFGGVACGVMQGQRSTKITNSWSMANYGRASFSTLNYTTSIAYLVDTDSIQATVQRSIIRTVYQKCDRQSTRAALIFP